MVDGFLDNLVEKKVVNKKTLQSLEKRVSNIITETQNFIEKFSEQNQHKIYMVVGNSNKQLSVGEYLCPYAVSGF